MWLIGALKTCWQEISGWFVALWQLLVTYSSFVLIFSITSLVFSIAGCTALITFLPHDYFTETKQGQHIKNPILRFFVSLLKNIVGGVLIIVGALMSVPGIPGQGLLTIFSGLIISDFPGKKRLARRLIRTRAVYLAANKIREYFKRPPLVLEKKEELDTHHSEE
ncbi:MAG: hypothetical protein OXI43_21485 [Candidatus Poribacteria bacterium]|nr:hypothetical protein [Candidatus Poribacteria bacterium]